MSFRHLLIDNNSTLRDDQVTVVWQVVTIVESVVEGNADTDMELVVVVPA